MNGLVQLLFGPLAAPECRRSLSRGWVRWGQVVAALPGAGVALVVVWTWWFFRMFDPTYQPSGAIVLGLMTVEWIMLIVALVISPAIIAGTLAGERARGVLPLLLASSISTREIVTGRLVGRLAQVGVFLFASMPALSLLAGFASLPIGIMAMLFILPMSVAIGSGGISLLASAMSRRARDALLAVYLLQLLLFLVPILGWNVLPASFWDVIGPVNPFYGLSAFVRSGQMMPVVYSCLVWLGLGLLGTWMAAWRLRVEYLRQADVSQLDHQSGRAARPPVGDDPMLWKEIYFERVGRFSRFVWWLGMVIFAVLLAGSVGLVGIIAWAWWFRADAAWHSWAIAQLQVWAGSSALPLSWLVQWTIALRAAVAVASEREHGTWDALLLSSLEGREIIRAKIWGNLHSLRGFIAAAAIVWTLAALVGAMELETYLCRLAITIVASIFMTAAGVWISLGSSTATRAMTFTIATWLVAAACFAVIATMIVAVITLIIMMAWLAINQTTLFSGGRMVGPSIPISFEAGVTLARLVLYGTAAFLLAAYCRYRFDTLAGRIPQAKELTESNGPLEPNTEAESVWVAG